MEFNFEWDVHKATSNLSKHGVAFAEAATVLQDALALTVFDAQHSTFEERWFTLGVSAEGRFLAVSHTFAHLDDGNIKVRLISARSATKAERRGYENEAR